ncbi:MAG: bacillithiol biosynthesis cysteine-adding enzyme BshC [Bacteroidetes bacterium]|nr:bacillithiol biosynthesis cysteine-adding enzyme BshC [Bacteroidota bacterium]MCH8523525.1 bacillithiol biosynthesis cysteine-adding enzyme BshC [Balneolales bacterium]
MTSNPHSYDALPFGKLFRDYVKGATSIQSFFDYGPFQPADIKSKAASTHFTASRTNLYEAIKEYNNTSLRKVDENLKTLRDDNKSLTVVTGQQLTTFGGPLFTLYKAATAIALSRKYTELLNRRIIPVFWLADEDHDFHEIAKLGFPDKGIEWNTFQLPETDFTGWPVGKIPLENSINSLLDALKKELPETDFSSDIIHLLTDGYQPGKTHAQAFGAIIQNLFADYGLILAGSSSNGVKQLLKDQITNLIDRTGEVHAALERQSALLETSYHRQAAVSTSNWFILDEKGYRRKLQFHKNEWSSGNMTFTKEELLEVAKKSPHRLSPNVFLRPILQDTLLPNIAYVAGPGEIAYYAQMKELYKVCKKSMPVIVPRLSATLIEPNINKFLAGLPFAIGDYAERVEDLQQRYVEKEQTFDIQAFANKWITEIEKLADERTSDVDGFDTTLVGTLVRVRQEQVNAVHTLRQKMIKSEKNRLDVQLKRISKVQLALFPNMNLQEREMAFIYPLCKYGRSFIDKIIQEAEISDGTAHRMIDL